MQYQNQANPPQHVDTTVPGCPTYADRDLRLDRLDIGLMSTTWAFALACSILGNIGAGGVFLLLILAAGVSTGVVLYRRWEIKNSIEGYYRTPGYRRAAQAWSHASQLQTQMHSVQALVNEAAQRSGQIAQRMQAAEHSHFEKLWRQIPIEQMRTDGIGEGVIWALDHNFVSTLPTNLETLWGIGPSRAIALEVRREELQRETRQRARVAFTKQLAAEQPQGLFTEIWKACHVSNAWRLQASNHVGAVQAAGQKWIERFEHVGYRHWLQSDNRSHHAAVEEQASYWESNVVPRLLKKGKKLLKTAKQASTFPNAVNDRQRHHEALGLVARYMEQHFGLRLRLTNHARAGQAPSASRRDGSPRSARGMEAVRFPIPSHLSYPPSAPSPNHAMPLHDSRRPSAAPSSRPTPPVRAPEAYAAESPRAVHQPAPSPPRWRGPNEEVVVHGRRIANAMLYVGQVDARALQRNIGQAWPALIDPSLAVTPRTPAEYGSELRYWPSYADMHPDTRSAYLDWLAAGRRDHSIPVGLAFVFFYGIERRLLLDEERPQPDSAESRALLREVERLRELFGYSRSFKKYATALLETFKDAPVPAAVPQYAPRKYPVAEQLQNIRAFAHLQQPLPRRWAWAWLHAQKPSECRMLTTPATKLCKQLFFRCYEDAYGAGMTLNAAQSTVWFDYAPASAGLHHKGIGRKRWTIDVSEATEEYQTLFALLETCSHQLSTYRSYVEENPGSANSIQALSLAPKAALAPNGSDALSAYLATLEALLHGKETASSHALPIIQPWLKGGTHKLGKRRAKALGAFLSEQGYGIEPSLEHGGVAPKTTDSLLLFRRPAGAPVKTDDAYRAAMVLMRLAVAVAAKGELGATRAERDALDSMIDNAFDLPEVPRVRLRAHTRWLLREPPSMRGISQRLKKLSTQAKQAVVPFVLAIVCADGKIEPAEIKSLETIYDKVGLDPASVFADLNALAASAPTSQAPASQAPTSQAPASHQAPKAAAPVAASAPGSSAKPASPSTPAGPEPQAKPAGPESRARATASVPGSSSTAPAGGLDMARVAAKMKETRAVSEALASIFDEEEVDQAPASSTATPEPTNAAAETGNVRFGLNEAQTALALALFEEANWTRAGFEALANEHQLMPDGAYTAINEAAFEICDSPLLEGDDPIELDPYTQEEMLAHG